MNDKQDRTHYEGCETHPDHRQCAAARLQKIKERRARLVSDWKPDIDWIAAQLESAWSEAEKYRNALSDAELSTQTHHHGIKTYCGLCRGWRLPHDPQVNHASHCPFAALSGNQSEETGKEAGEGQL